MTEATNAIQYIRPDAPLPPESRRRGVRTEAWTPATLDLADRARLAVNGMVEPTDPEGDYRVCWKASFCFNPPVMYHDGSDTGITLKFLEAAPRMRLMSRSEQGLHVEQHWREVLLCKGHDIVYVDPPGKLCPLYQRDHYRDDVTLWKRTTRYLDEQLLDW